MTKRAVRMILVVAASWFAMQAVHELGHVFAAWLTGGHVVRVLLHPLTISRTDVSPNPAPLAVAWGGPLVGVALPLLLTIVCRLAPKAPIACCRPYVDFFAGFSLIANGAYIGVGSLEGVGDAGDLLRHGSPRWLLIAFGLASASAGLWIWHVATWRSGVPPHAK